MDENTDSFKPETCHEILLRGLSPILRFLPARDMRTWPADVSAKLREIVGPDPQTVALDVQVAKTVHHEGFCETRYYFTSETGARVPCHLLVPTGRSRPVPLVICLQGHTSGMHISLGRPKSEEDKRMVADGDRDFALQAVAEGYAALTIEQRCFGERRDGRPDRSTHHRNGCEHASLVALLLGRTMIGERVWDVRRAIDSLVGFPEIDLRRIGCMGNSGGGTITYFAACLEPRIAIAMPSCYVCSLRRSIARIDHCPDNYIPGFLRWFELADLACLIAPRPLVVVAGESDPIFPLEGVREAVDDIQRIYAAAGAPDRCRLVLGNGGHRFYASDAWPVFREMAGW